MSRKKKAIIAIVVVLALIIGLSIYSKLTSDDDAISIAKLKSDGPSAAGDIVRVKGEVQDGSVQWDPQKRIIRFALVDDNETLDVIYRGLPDDDFRPGQKITAEGMYTSAGVLEAQKFSSGRSAFCNVCH